MPCNLSVSYMRKPRPRVGVRTLGESVTEHSLVGPGTSCSIRPLPGQSGLTPVPLHPHPGAPSLPATRLPPYLESCVETLPHRHCLPDERLLKWLVSAPGEAHHTAHHPSHRSHHFCFLPRPSSCGHGSPLLSPPTSTHLVFISSSGLSDNPQEMKP